MYGSLTCKYVYVSSVSGVYGGQKKVLDALGLEVYTTMSHFVGAGNIVEVLGNSNQFS